MQTESTETPSERLDEAWVLDRLQNIWPAHNEGLAELLIVLRHLFDGDLDAVLVLTVLAVGARNKDWHKTLYADRFGLAVQKPTNIQSIASITGIPRESVRRKLLALAGKGWVARNDRRQWVITQAAAGALKPGTEAAIAYFVKVFRAAKLPGA